MMATNNVIGSFIGRIEYLTSTIAILTDLRNPYTELGLHPEWHDQYIKTIANHRVCHILEQKFSRFGRVIICLSKIAQDYHDLLLACNYLDATVVIISSMGEHSMTPWMIIHNIGHTIISWDISIKRDIIQILDLNEHSFTINKDQEHLVDCASARRHTIPNLNELIYELYTTWIWHGKTKTKHAALKTYCDNKFPELMDGIKNQMIYHRYRQPIATRTATPAILGLIS